MILAFDCRCAFQFLQFHTFISFLSNHWSWCTICQNLPYASLCCICPVFGVSRSQNDKAKILKHRLRWACSCCLRLRTLLRMSNSFFVLRIETTKNPKLKLCNEIHHSRWIDISVDGKNRQNVDDQIITKEFLGRSRVTWRCKPTGMGIFSRKAATLEAWFAPVKLAPQLVRQLLISEKIWNLVLLKAFDLPIIQPTHVPWKNAPVSIIYIYIYNLYKTSYSTGYTLPASPQPWKLHTAWIYASKWGHVGMLSESAVRLVQTYEDPSSKLFPSHLVEWEVTCFLTGYKTLLLS